MFDSSPAAGSPRTRRPVTWRTRRPVTHRSRIAGRSRLLPTPRRTRRTTTRPHPRIPPPTRRPRHHRIHRIHTHRIPLRKSASLSLYQRTLLRRRQPIPPGLARVTNLPVVRRLLRGRHPIPPGTARVSQSTYPRLPLCGRHRSPLSLSCSRPPLTLLSRKPLPPGTLPTCLLLFRIRRLRRRRRTHKQLPKPVHNHTNDGPTHPPPQRAHDPTSSTETRRTRPGGRPLHTGPAPGPTAQPATRQGTQLRAFDSSPAAGSPRTRRPVTWRTRRPVTHRSRIAGRSRLLPAPRRTRRTTTLLHPRIPPPTTRKPRHHRIRRVCTHRIPSLTSTARVSHLLVCPRLLLIARHPLPPGTVRASQLVSPRLLLIGRQRLPPVLSCRTRLADIRRLLRRRQPVPPSFVRGSQPPPLCHPLFRRRRLPPVLSCLAHLAVMRRPLRRRQPPPPGFARVSQSLHLCRLFLERQPLPPGFAPGIQSLHLCRPLRGRPHAPPGTLLTCILLRTIRRLRRRRCTHKQLPKPVLNHSNAGHHAHPHNGKPAKPVHPHPTTPYGRPALHPGLVAALRAVQDRPHCAGRPTGLRPEQLQGGCLLGPVTLHQVMQHVPLAEPGYPVLQTDMAMDSGASGYLRVGIGWDLLSVWVPSNLVPFFGFAVVSHG